MVFTDIRTFRSDEIIANIDMDGSCSKLCTSQNVAYIVKKIISSTSDDVEIDMEEINDLLLSLSIRHKDCIPDDFDSLLDDAEIDMEEMNDLPPGFPIWHSDRFPNDFDSL